MQRMIWAVLIAFAAALALGPVAIRWLTKLRFSQNIYALAPESHQKKQGTPTMGGLFFALCALGVAFSLQLATGSVGDLSIALALFALANMAIGFADDMTKVKGKKNQGLTEWQKIAMQLVIGALFSYFCAQHPLVGSMIVVPFSGITWDLGALYIPVMVLIILATTNGTNLLDGLDGLCASVSSVVMTTYALFALIFAGLLTGTAQANLLSVGILCAAVCGALLGYLRFNLHPAQVMMGDTGSMFLGGMAVGAAMLLQLPLTIPLVGGAYAASIGSVFLQRMYFKATRGKRIFKMSPLHHHFELSGVPETRIVSLYTIASVLLSLVTFLGIPL